MILDGTKVKKKILDQLKNDIDLLVKNHNAKPGLAVILVGNNPASKAS